MATPFAYNSLPIYVTTLGFSPLPSVLHRLSLPPSPSLSLNRHLSLPLFLSFFFKPLPSSSLSLLLTPSLSLSLSLSEWQLKHQASKGGAVAAADFVCGKPQAAAPCLDARTAAQTHSFAKGAGTIIRAVMCKVDMSASGAPMREAAIKAMDALALAGLLGEGSELHRCANCAKFIGAFTTTPTACDACL
jgi:hypothetical protein